MSGLKVLLVYLSSRDENEDRSGFLPMAERMILVQPLGLWYLKAVGQRAGHTVEVLDQRVSRFTLASFIPLVASGSYDVVGFYDCDYGILHTKLAQYITAVKQTCNLPVIVGGPPSKDASSFAAGLDFRVHGEGERTFLEILEYYQGVRARSAIRGVSFQASKGQIVYHEPQPFIENLDTLPFPAFDPANINIYGNLFIIVARKPMMACLATRGCTRRCSYCVSHTHWGNRHRKRSPENVVAELVLYARKYKIKFIHFLDDILGVDEEWLMELCDRLISERLDLTWICNLSPIQFRKDTSLKMRQLRRAGCTALHFGLQSTEPRILERICRRPDEPEVLPRLLKAAKHQGILTYVDFIYGLPGETHESMTKTTDWVMTHRPHYITVWQLGVLEGSDIKKTYGDNRVTSLSPKEINDAILKTKRIFYRNPSIVLRLLWFILTNNPSFFRHIIRLLPVVLHMTGFQKMERHW